VGFLQFGVHFSGCEIAAFTALFVYLSSFCQRAAEEGLRRIMGPPLETGSVFDAVLSVNYCAIGIVRLWRRSQVFVMKKVGTPVGETWAGCRPNCYSATR
jgi:hypothetical protein